MKSSAFFLGCTLALLAALFFTDPAQAQENLPAYDDDQPYHVCIDPGHGGSRFSGTYNTRYDLREDDVVLDLAFRLQVLLEESGFAVTLTRQETIENPTLWERVLVCRDAEADILVSLHLNASQYGLSDGAMSIYYYEEDIALAEAIQSPLYEALGSDHATTWEFLDLGVRRYRSGLLRRWYDRPGVLVEPAFLTRDEQAKLMLDTGPDSRRQQIVEAVFSGISNYFDGVTEEEILSLTPENPVGEQNNKP